MRVLGISCFTHQAAAALIVDGQVAAAATEERFTRQRGDRQFPAQAINYCMEASFTQAKDLDLVVFFQKPGLLWKREWRAILGGWPRSSAFFKDAALSQFCDYGRLAKLVERQVGLKKDKLVFCNQALALASSVYYPSAFPKAALLMADSGGDWASGARGSAWGTELTLDEEFPSPHSLGLLYAAFASFMGYDPLQGRGQVMDLAAYGQPQYLEKILKNLLTLNEDGSFKLHLEYFNYLAPAGVPYTDKFTSLFGAPRPPQEAQRLDGHWANLAASVQAALEEVLLCQARGLQRKYGHTCLCLAGDLALNSAAMGRLYREAGFENLALQWTSSGEAGALGAALWGYFSLLGGTKRVRLLSPYLGSEQDDFAAGEYLRSQNCKFREFSDMNGVYQEAVARLQYGQSIAWVKGRTEFGPHALGARSILVDPRRPYSAQMVDSQLRGRDPFRPLGVSIMNEALEDYFEAPNSQYLDPLRFRSLALSIYEDRQELVPSAFNNQAQSAVQAVYAQESPYFYELLSHFYQATGVPLLLNSSFRLPGEPLVDTPAQALEAFTRSDVDALFIGKLMVSRRPATEERHFQGVDLKTWTPKASPSSGQNAQGRAAAAREIVYHREDRRPWSDQLGAVGQVLKYVALFLLIWGIAELAAYLTTTNVPYQLRGIYRSTEKGVRLTPKWSGRVRGAEFSQDIHLDGDGWRQPPALRPVDSFGSSEVRQLSWAANIESDAVSSRRPGVGQTILALGDSFTFGAWQPMEDTWLNQIQRISGAKILNYALPQAGTDFEVDLYRQLTPTQRQAEVVLLGFYTGNDYYENMVTREGFTVADGLLRLTPKAQARWGKYDCLAVKNAAQLPSSDRLSFFQILAGRSYLYAWLSNLSWGSKALSPSAPQAWYLNKYSAEMRQGVDNTLAALNQLNELCGERGSALVVVLIPSAYEVSDGLWQEWLEDSDLNADLFDRAKPRQILIDWAETKGVYIVDLWPSLVNRPAMYYRNDPNFNALGHFQTGEVVSQYLDRSGVFDVNMIDTFNIEGGGPDMMPLEEGATGGDFEAEGSTEF